MEEPLLVISRGVPPIFLSFQKLAGMSRNTRVSHNPLSVTAMPSST
jgi:hypothetical protein